MNRRITREISRRKFNEIFALDLSEILRRFEDGQCDFVHHDGTTFRIRSRAYYRSREKGIIRVIVSVDDRSILSSIVPTTRRKTIYKTETILAEEMVNDLFSNQKELLSELLRDPVNWDYTEEIEKDGITYKVNTRVYYENKWTKENVRVCVTVNEKEEMLHLRRAIVHRSWPTKELWPDGIPAVEP